MVKRGLEYSSGSTIEMVPLFSFVVWQQARETVGWKMEVEVTNQGTRVYFQS
jgi:hypothetical protein